MRLPEESAHGQTGPERGPAMMPRDFRRDVSTILITCPWGAGHLLADELKGLSYRTRKVASSYVSLRGTMTDCMELNLALFTAQRVLYLVDTFPCADPQELYRRVAELPWEAVLTPDSYLSVASTVDTPSIRDTRYPNLKCKDAIVDRLARVFGKRCDSGPQRDRAVVHVHWVGGTCSVYLDTSGEPLSRRGYRLFPGRAPMQETLAAAVIMTTVWDRKSHFVNPMCGSGTLAIEAALMALGRGPGLGRENFGFMHLGGFDRNVFSRVKDQMRGRARGAASPEIVATDIDTEAVSIARANARRAGVEELIRFGVCDFQQTDVPAGRGVVVLNPEYGHRLGDTAELSQVYKRIGDFLKRSCAGYTGYVFSGNFDLVKRVGLKARRRISFDNGGIDCRLYEYELYAGSRVTGRIPALTQ